MALCLRPAGWVFSFHESLWRWSDTENFWESWGPGSKLVRVMVSQFSVNNFQTKTLLRFRHALHFIISECHIFFWWRLIAKKKIRKLVVTRLPACLYRTLDLVNSKNWPWNSLNSAQTAGVKAVTSFCVAEIPHLSHAVN